MLQLKILIFITLSSSLLFGSSFSTSKKKLLKKVYYDHKVTFYCQNPYEIKQVKGKQKTLIIADRSKYSPRNTHTKKGKINIRAKRVEREHIIPAQNFGRQLTCWRNGNDRCISKKA